MLHPTLFTTVAATCLLSSAGLAQGNFHDVDLALAGSDRALAADKGLYRAASGGLPVQTSLSAQSSADRVLSVSVDPFDSETWIVAQEQPGEVARLVRYRSDTDTFTSVDIPNFGTPSDLSHSPFTPGRVVAARRSDNPINQGMRVSDDGGLNWDFSYGTLSESVAQVEFDKFNPNLAMAFLASGTRLLSANNGLSFYAPNPQVDLPSGPLSLVCSTHTNLLWYATTEDKRVWRTEDRGNSWTELPALGFDIHEHPQIPDMVWLANSNGRLQFSMDRGDHWSTPQDVAPFDGTRVIRAMAYDFKSDRLLLAGDADTHAETTSPAVRIGSGSLGSGGFRPRPYLGGVVEPGNSTFSFKADQCLGDATVVQLVSLNSTTSFLLGGVFFLDAPINIVLFGVAEAPAGQAGLPGKGTFETAAPLPNNPAIAGTDFYTQCLVVDPGAAGGFDVALSPALRVLGQP